jgi:hypothetical protein
MTTRWFAKLSTLLAITAVLGCNEATSPKATGPLLFEAKVSPSTIRVGETATFTLVLQNTSAEPIVLNFPSSCQVVPYVGTTTGQVVYPHAGGWGCYQALTQLRLEPGAIVVQSIDVHGGEIQPTIYTGPQLAPGSYKLWGELGVAPQVQGRTLSAELTVVE